ncbi:MAG: polynucleotide adenylyltransferase PcnB [Chlamydiota bacterium]|nr:polynucleotide adenylyltransferase PcnB [Chlamydiota bacterium]
MQKKIYKATEHDVDHRLIDIDALEVISRLREAGYETYLVGGSVRDILTGQSPKDFDISTAARPEEIKKVFGRQCLLIGRRFRLAHIRFGHKVIEVATFRSGENTDSLITRDNVWGSPEQDALRRDFTINGLFYDPSNHTIIDYVGGWKDIHDGILKSIGDPIVRFKQDPVRMIRLLKFKARFGFKISTECQHALDRCKEELMKSSPARILEEMLRMLESGSSENFFRLMTESDLLELLFTCLTHFIQGEHGEEIYAYLRESDTLNKERKYRPLDRNVLASCLLFPILEHEIKHQLIDKEVTPHIGDIMLLSAAIIKGFVTSSFSHFPKKMSSTIGYILTTQFRFTPFSGKKHHKPKLFHHKEFPLALQFLKLRSLIDPSLVEEYTEWKNLYKQHKHHQPRPHHPPQKKYWRGPKRERRDAH